MARSRVRWSSITAVTIAFALALSACSSSDDTSAASEQTLASFMGWEEEDDGAAEARWREQEVEVEELTRTCMAEKGFEYIPVDRSSQSFVSYDEQDEEERLRKEGFGITTWYGDDGIDDAVDAVEEEWNDPNWELVEAMSESEQQAYYEALHGSEEEQMAGATTEYDPETGEEVGYMTEGWGAGCQGEAYEAVYGGDDDQSLWEELGPAFEELYERVEADPRLIEWNEEWSRCMAEAGHDYASPNQMHESLYEEFQERLDEILGPDGGYVDPFEGMTEAEVEAFFEERTEDEIDAFFQQSDQQRNENVDQEALSALQQEEIDLAITEYECRDGEAYWELYQEISAEYEADFIAENRETLERLREAGNS